LIMTKAIEHIVAGYVTLKNRQALEEIRDHRQRLLHDSRMHTGTWVSVESLTSALQEEINIADAALSGLQEEATDNDGDLALNVAREWFAAMFLLSELKP
jgi:hypothetical protein